MSSQPFLVICDDAAIPDDLAGSSSVVRKSLSCRGSNPTLNLHADISAVLLTGVADRSSDLIHIASYAYAADQEISRGGPTDLHGKQWRRHLIMCVPVIEPEFWSDPGIRSLLSETLRLLTDDQWEFHFSQSWEEKPQPHLNLVDAKDAYGRPDTVILLSGGADSLCATVEAITKDGRLPIVVSHRPTAFHSGRQNHLLDQLSLRLDRMNVPHASFWINRVRTDPADSSQRSRAFLFAALGAAVANELGIEEVYLADNGVVSLNLPISAQLIGAMASRSTHPKFIASFNRLSHGVFTSAPRIVNPFWNRTRAETLGILKDAKLEDLLQETISCSHVRGTTSVQPQCGSCYQCVDRRFAVIAAGLEEHDLAERYVRDMFVQALPEGEPRTVAESYVRFARQVIDSSPEQLFAQFPQLEDCLLHDDPHIDRTAKALVAMIQRHARETLDVVETMIGRYKAELAAGHLPETSLLRLIAGPGTHMSPSSEPSRNQFRRDGRVRIVTFQGLTINLVESKALGYIERLMRAQPSAIHVKELVSLESSANGGNAEPSISRGKKLNALDAQLIDSTTRDQILAQVRELDERRILAIESGHDDVGAKLDREILDLEDYLQKSSGPGGQPRQFSEEDDKIRQAVSKLLNRARRQIAQSHPPLGAHLARFLRVGWTCSYDPDPPVVWDT